VVSAKVKFIEPYMFAR